MTARLRWARAEAWFLSAFVVLFLPSHEATAAVDQDAVGAVARATEFTLALDYEKAHAALAGVARSSANVPEVRVAQARLALYEEDCDLAASLLAQEERADTSEARQIRDVARGCARVIAGTIVDHDEANGVVVRYHDEADRALTPLLVETVKKARITLSNDLGVEWRRPTRITVVRDLLSLSAMTGLPYEAAQTTGTVAVAKWGRVTLLSPRASAHGYPFRDTLTHELTHLAIAFQTLDRAPLWLHEGLARREEVRWREPGPFDERPSPESLVLRGIAMKLDLPLDKLGPSIAMLPSADAAMVAFAEVTSFVKFFIANAAPDALSRLLAAFRSGSDTDRALHDVSGARLAEWDTRWRAHLVSLKHEELSPMFGLGAKVPGLTTARERSRLAELLFARNHASEALTELEQVPPAMLGDPSLRYLRARVLEGSERAQEAGEWVSDVAKAMANYGPSWAMRGRLAFARGDMAVAEESFAYALAHDPFSVEAACRVRPGLEGQAALAPHTPGDLCETARARAEPDLGRE